MPRRRKHGAAAQGHFCAFCQPGFALQTAPRESRSDYLRPMPGGQLVRTSAPPIFVLGVILPEFGESGVPSSYARALPESSEPRSGQFSRRGYAPPSGRIAWRTGGTRARRKARKSLRSPSILRGL